MTVAGRKPPARRIWRLLAVLVIFLSGAFGIYCWRSSLFGPADSHQRMLRLLAELRDDDLENNELYSRAVMERAEAELAALPRSSYIEDRIDQHNRVARLQLLMGEPAAAAENFSQALSAVRRLGGRLGPEFEQTALLNIAVAHLRRGEIENCVDNCTCDSCILPIRDRGIHRKQQGSRDAISYLTQLLEQQPDNLTARWLLNVAAMTVDEYPEKVPANFLIPSEVFASHVDFPRFMNMAAPLGVDTVSLSGGIIADDFNNDGWLDLVVSDWGPAGQLRFYKNLGGAKFVDETAAAGLIGLYGGLNLVQADYDNDGDLDILVLRGAWRGGKGRLPNSLLQNDGSARFRDVTFDVGLGAAHFPTQTAAWADYDLDGDLDLYVGNEAFACQLFQNDGRGHFVDVAEQAGVTGGDYTKGVVWGDYNNDRYPDLYVSTYGKPYRLADEASSPYDLFASGTGAPNRLYRNNQDGTFTDVATELNVTKPLLGFPTWFWDVNNDGALDLFAASFDGTVAEVAAEYLGLPQQTEPDCLYLGDGDGGFREVAADWGLRRVSLAMGANFGDLDNDGYDDFYLGTGAPPYESLTPNLMFLNQAGQSFADITTAGGFGHLQKGHGVAFADFDNDGDQDVACVLGGAYAGDFSANALFVNPGFDNRWLCVRLQGTTSNRAAIGARVRIDVQDEQGKTRSIYKWVNSGGSFGANPLRREIGLGKASKIVALEIFWPATGKTQTFDDVPFDEFIEIVEGDSKLHVVSVDRGTATTAPTVSR